MSQDFLGDGYRVTLARLNPNPRRSWFDRLLHRRPVGVWETVFVGVPTGGSWSRRLGAPDLLDVQAQDLGSYLLDLLREPPVDWPV